MKHYRNNLNEIIQSYINSVREFEPLISASPKSARYRVFTRNIEEYIKTVNIAYSCLEKEADSKKIPACCVKLKTALHDKSLLSERAQHNNTLVSVELLRDTATMMLRVINENRHAFITEKAPKSFSVGI